MDPSLNAAPLAPDATTDQLAKAWLVGVIERTPLDRVGEVDLDLLTTEGKLLIADILEDLEAGTQPPRDLPASARERARELGRLRSGDRASAEVPRDLAVLQSVLIESLLRGEPHRRADEVQRSVQRLAEIFGSVHAALTEGFLRGRDPGDLQDPDPPLPGSEDLNRSVQVMVAEHRRYGRPFAVALLELEGIGSIFETRGRKEGGWMLTAAAAVIRSQIRIVDQAFQVRDDAFCVLAPNVTAGRLRRMADRLARVVEASQAADAPRIAISAGVSACPEHGQDADRLLEVAGEALDAARAAGEPVQVAALNGSRAQRES